MTGGAKILVNRAPVLTLWGAVVAERMGYAWEEALTFGKLLAGKQAQDKGRSLGIYHEKPGSESAPKHGLGEEFWIELCGRPIPAKRTLEGVRAVVKDAPIDPASVRRYLEQKFGEGYPAALEAMRHLAASRTVDALRTEGFSLYERFRPQIPRGTAGWGAKGLLDLDRIRALAAPKRPR
jgi:hypothetical protein